MRKIFLTISITFFTLVCHTQDLSRLTNKIFIGRRLEYLKFLNDTTLYSSINSYTDTARFLCQNDSIFIHQRFWRSDQTGTKRIDSIYSYKIIKLTNDTISLKNNYNHSIREDTFFFVNIEKLKQSSLDFIYLKVEYYSPWSGAKKITIDSSGKVFFIDDPIMYSINNPDADKDARPKNISGVLTRKEFENFKTLLLNSLPTKLPPKRGCPMDGATSNFEILLGTKKIKSTGCNLSWIHRTLLNYLLSIDENKGLLKSKVGEPKAR